MTHDDLTSQEVTPELQQVWTAPVITKIAIERTEFGITIPGG